MRRFKNIPVVVLLAALAIPNASAAEKPMRITVEPATLSIGDGADVLMRYRYQDVPFKPCVQQLFTPDGINILRDSPSDHKHHHALMFAIAVDGLNFWEEQKEPGRQVHRSFTDTRVEEAGDLLRTEFTEQLDWVNPRSGELLIKESRTISVCRPEDLDATILSWKSRLSLPAGKQSATLTGSHYFGLGMRFLESMDEGGQFHNAAGQAGEIVRGEERLIRANWCALTANADGKLVTIAMFGHPGNERHPTYWFTMAKPFAYLSATLNLHREPLELNSEKPLVLRYGVAVWDGQVEADIVEQAYQWWMDHQ